MSKLVLQDEHGFTKEFALDRERITIGRKAHSDIHLDDSAVSGNHAVIITLGSDSFLEDLESTNGTKVNQKSVHKCVLQDEDEIRIAHYTLTFISEVLETSAPGKTIAATPRTEIISPPREAALDDVTIMPESTRLKSPNDPDTLTQDDVFESQEETPTGDGTLGVLRIPSGPGAGQILELSRPVTTLGKPGIQVAAITLRDGQYYLGLIEGTDLPLINGSEIKTLPCQLKSRDIINIAGISLEFFLK
ncbi:MAG: FHA domain-containing protein [Sulfuricella denitrificans]|nr:FHA domain-containing protein [Sulfuricella denitrificans]